MVTFVHDGKTVTIPDPRDPHGVEDRLRGGMATLDDMVYAATVMAAYREMFKWPQQRRNRLIRKIKEVMGWPTPLAGELG
ncbi:hypothetical protein Kisp02_54120 [Kineosporia sp. NBRC 101731]|nr:hypothetical protein Kisp02_54120 [Kineosporia sp. NBRC 101731]